MDRGVDTLGDFCAVLIFYGSLTVRKRVPDLLFGVGRFGIQVSQLGADFLDTLGPVDLGVGCGLWFFLPFGIQVGDHGGEQCQSKHDRRALLAPVRWRGGLQ